MTIHDKPVYTPWGKADHEQTYAEGIVFYNTSSHGGFKLDRIRNAQVPPALRERGGWYEEDCAWAKVVYAFPAIFPEEELASAIQTLKTWYPDAWESLTGTTLAPGESFIKDERCFLEEHASDWIVISAITSEQQPGMVECIATLGGTRNGIGERRFLVSDDEYRQRKPFGFVIDETRHAPYGRQSSFAILRGASSDQHVHVGG
jgi:hypothetical protein